MKAIHLVLCGLALLVPSGRAQEAPLPDPAQPPAAQYLIECQLMRVPAKELVTLVPAFDDDATAVGAWEKLQGMIGRGEATLAASLLARGPAGQTISAESVEEMNYASSFEATIRPPDFHFSPHSVALLKAWPHVGIYPSEFKQQRLGESMDVRVRRTADPQVLDCELSLWHREPLGFRTFPAGRLENGEQLTYDQPRWSDLSNAAKLLITLGRPAVVGVHPVAGAPSTFELAVLRITGDKAIPERAEPAAPWKVEVDMQIVAVPKADALPLIPRLRSAEGTEGATKEVQEMITSDRAELLGWPMVLLDTSHAPIQLGPRVEPAAMPASKALEIVMYPTEFEPAQLPGYGHFWGIGRIDIPLEDRLSPSISVPYFFDARDAGHWLEAQASVGAERRIQLDLHYELVRLQAMEPALCVRFDRPGGEPILQPRFYSAKATASVTVPSGGRALLGTMLERGDHSRMILFLLHATARPSPALHP